MLFLKNEQGWTLQAYNCLLRFGINIYIFIWGDQYIGDQDSKVYIKNYLTEHHLLSYFSYFFYHFKNIINSFFSSHHLLFSMH